MLWVLVVSKVQCLSNTQHWPEGPINVQHPNLLALLDDLALLCPHEAIHRSLTGIPPKGPFVLSEVDAVLVLPETPRTLG